MRAPAFTSSARVVLSMVRDPAYAERRVLLFAAMERAGLHNYFDGKAKAWFRELPPKPSGYIQMVAEPVIDNAALAFGLPTDQDELDAFFNARRTSRFNT